MLWAWAETAGGSLDFSSPACLKLPDDLPGCVALNTMLPRAQGLGLRIERFEGPGIIDLNAAAPRRVGLF